VPLGYPSRVTPQARGLAFSYHPRKRFRGIAGFGGLNGTISRWIRLDGRKVKANASLAANRTRASFPTDPDSRIVKSPKGCLQRYDAQAMASCGTQAIVAADVTQPGERRPATRPDARAVPRAGRRAARDVSGRCRLLERVQRPARGHGDRSVRGHHPVVEATTGVSGAPAPAGPDPEGPLVQGTDGAQAADATGSRSRLPAGPCARTLWRTVSYSTSSPTFPREKNESSPADGVGFNHMGTGNARWRTPRSRSGGSGRDPMKVVVTFLAALSSGACSDGTGPSGGFGPAMMA